MRAAIPRFILVAIGSAAALVSTAEAQSAREWSVRNAGSLNTEYHEAFSSVTPDGLTIFISSNRPGGYGTADLQAPWPQASYDIYVAHRHSRDAAWGPVTNLGPLINTEFSEHSPMLSPDGHYLYFVSTRTDLENFGENDLFVSYREDIRDDLGWQVPVNIGESVNSPWTESCPFYQESEDGDRSFLYFVQATGADVGTLDIKVSELDRKTGVWTDPVTADLSSERGDGHFDPEHGLIWGIGYDGGYGGSDIWVVESMTGVGANMLGSIVNLGDAINTEHEETMPSATWDGQRLFFNSNRPGGQGGFDIYEARSLAE